MLPLTVKQLDDWMKANCYNDSYGIADRTNHEGFGLEQIGGLFVWYYTERGDRQNLKYFQTEQEAVAFAFDAIVSDDRANRHLVGFITDREQEQELLQELHRRHVAFTIDQIPYNGLHDLRSLVFVFGCDINKVHDLRHRFNQTN